MKKIFRISVNEDSSREELAKQIIEWLEEHEEFESYQLIIESLKD